MSIGGGDDGANLRGAGIPEDHSAGSVGSGREEAVEAGGRTWKTGGVEVKLAHGFFSVPESMKKEVPTDEGGGTVPSYERFPPAMIDAMDLPELYDAREAINGQLAAAKEKFNSEAGQIVENALAKVPEDAQAMADAIIREELGIDMDVKFEDIFPPDDPMSADAYQSLKELVDAKKEFLALQYVKDRGIDVGATPEKLEGLMALSEDKIGLLDTLATINKREASNLMYYSDYTEEADGLRKGIDAPLGFNEAFLNKEDLTQAKKMLDYFDKCIEGYIGISGKSADEIAVAEIPGVPNFTSLKLELYKNFYMNPETGAGWTEGSRAPSTNTVDNWIKNTLKPAAEKSFASEEKCTPLERRNAAVYSMFEKMEILNGLAEKITDSTLVFDGGREIVLGHNEAGVYNDNDSEVWVDNGKVMYREAPTERTAPSGLLRGAAYLFTSSAGDLVEKEAKELKPGESVDLGNGVKLTLGVEPGARAIMHYTDEEIYESSPRPPIFEENLERGRPTLHTIVDGAPVPLEAWVSTKTELDFPFLQEQLLGIQGYIHHKMDASLARQDTWVDHSTRSELIREDQEVKLAINRASQGQEDSINRDLQTLSKAHGFALPEGIDADALDQVHFEALCRQADIANASDLDVASAVGKMRDLFGDAKGMLLDRTDNEEKIEVLQQEITKLETELASLRLADNERLQKEAALANLKSDVVWYEKDSTIALMEKCIDSISINSNLNEVKRPPMSEENLDTLNAAFQALGKQLNNLDKKEAALKQEASAKHAQLASSGASILSLGGAVQLASDHVKTYLNKQTSLEELAQRKHLAEIGYSMGDEFNKMKDEFHDAVMRTGRGEVTALGVAQALKEQATELANALHDNPELGALIVADVSQIKDILGNQGVAATLQNRLQAHTLTKAFLQGVPGDKGTPPDPATVRRLQAIADFLRVAVPLTGAAQGATQTNWVSSLTGKIPVVGGALSMLTGAIYGAASAEVVRNTVTRMDDSTREQAFAIASAISSGSPKGFVEAHAKIDAARAAGEISKAFTDKGSFGKNLLFRAGRFAKHFVTEKWGAMARLFKSSKSIGDKVIAVVGMVGPVAGVAVGALAMAGVIASGPFMPLAIILVGSLYAVSSYAKTKQPVIDYLNDQKKADAKELEEQFKQSPSEKMEELQKEYKKSANLAVRKGHKRGLYDAQLREHVDAFNNQPQEKKEATINEYCESNVKEFTAFLQEREAFAEKHFETLTVDQIKAEFHQKHLIKTRMEKFVDEMYQNMIERYTQQASGVDFSHEVSTPNPLDVDPKKPKGVDEDAFDDVLTSVTSQDAPLDSFRFGIDVRPAAKAA